MQSNRREVKYYAGEKLARERLQIRLIPRGGRGDRADHGISPLRTSVLPRLLRFLNRQAYREINSPLSLAIHLVLASRKSPVCKIGPIPLAKPPTMGDIHHAQLVISGPEPRRYAWRFLNPPMLRRCPTS